MSSSIMVRGTATLQKAMRVPGGFEDGASYEVAVTVTQRRAQIRLPNGARVVYERGDLYVVDDGKAYQAFTSVSFLRKTRWKIIFPNPAAFTEIGKTENDRRTHSYDVEVMHGVTGTVENVSVKAYSRTQAAAYATTAGHIVRSVCMSG